MKSRNTKGKTLGLNPTWYISISIFLITVCVNTSLADPFNSPKLWLLIISGSWLLGYILVAFKSSKQYFRNEFKIFFVLLMIFLTFMLISAFQTESTYTAVFGQTQRRSGLLFYIFMAVFMLGSAIFFSFKSIDKIFKSALLLSLVLSFYGLLQKIGSDFVQWNNPYNSIILTLGNPNFAAALLSILSILVLIYAITIKNYLKYFLYFLGIFMLLLISYSNSRQGLVSFGIALGVAFVIIVMKFSLKWGIASGGIFIILFIYVILGMLQFGPLEKFVYKSSVSIRGYYWRAGIEMFKSHPLNGVGLDSYGDYFKEFREKEYALKYGYEITSDNAHNVVIHIFSTAGIFAGVTYLLLLLVVLTCGLKCINRSHGRELLLITGLFAAWVAYQAQSLISIDNVGLTIWGWVIGGAIVGTFYNSRTESLSSDQNKTLNNSNSSDFLQQRVTSFIFVLAMITLSSFPYQTEKKLFETINLYNFNSQQQSSGFNNSLSELSNLKLIEPAYGLRAVQFWYAVGETPIAKEKLQQLLAANSRCLDCLVTGAEISELSSEWDEAIYYRNRIARYDPWNAKNYLALAELNLKVLDSYTAKENLNKVLVFARSTPEGDAAEKKLEEIN